LKTKELPGGGIVVFGGSILAEENEAQGGVVVIDISDETNWGEGQIDAGIFAGEAKAYWDGGGAAEARAGMCWIEPSGSAKYKGFGIHGEIEAGVIGAQAKARLWDKGKLVELKAEAELAKAEPGVTLVLFGRRFGVQLRARFGAAIGLSIGSRTGVDLGPVGGYLILGEKD